MTLATGGSVPSIAVSDGVETGSSVAVGEETVASGTGPMVRCHLEGDDAARPNGWAVSKAAS